MSRHPILFALSKLNMENLRLSGPPHNVRVCARELIQTLPRLERLDRLSVDETEVQRSRHSKCYCGGIARLQCQVPTAAAALADIDPTRLPRSRCNTKAYRPNIGHRSNDIVKESMPYDEVSSYLLDIHPTELPRSGCHTTE